MTTELDASEIADEWMKAAVEAGKAVCDQHPPCNEWLIAALTAVAPLIIQDSLAAAIARAEKAEAELGRIIAVLDLSVGDKGPVETIEDMIDYAVGFPARIKLVEARAEAAEAKLAGIRDVLQAIAHDYHDEDAGEMARDALASIAAEKGEG